MSSDERVMSCDWMCVSDWLQVLCPHLNSLGSGLHGVRVVGTGVTPVTSPSGSGVCVCMCMHMYACLQYMCIVYRDLWLAEML